MLPPRVWPEQLERAVERNPGHRLAMHMVTRLAAHLPNPLVGLAPVGCHTVRCFAQQARERFIHGRGPCLVVDQRPISDFSIDVELPLSMGVVADTYRTSAGIPGNVVKAALLDT